MIESIRQNGDHTFSLQSPTLDEFVVYKLLQALSTDKYYNKCISIPSTGTLYTINVMIHDLMMLMQSIYVFLACDFLVKSPDSLTHCI